jgi:RluA family pseudouridine synthase
LSRFRDIRNSGPSPPFRGEREGPRRASAGERELGGAADCLVGLPHPTLSPRPAGGEGKSWATITGRGLRVREGLADRVLYRDGLILVIDKPAGVAVHPGPGGGPNLESAFGELRFGLPHSPALAHRLDRDTSGCLVLGRHPKALRRLGALFAGGEVEKIYWAVVEGHPPETDGRIETGLRKLNRGTGWRMIIDPAGQTAVTEYRLRGSACGRAWLELRPRTGRTHQLRVHCAALGCPVVGDPVYGNPASGGPLHLLARSIKLPLYPARAPLEITATVPDHMAEALRIMGCEEVPSL